MKNQGAVLLLTSELDADYSYIEEATALVDRARQRLELSGKSDELDLMVLGACLHGLYNAIEAYFLRIAKFFENNIDEAAWHRDMLDRMTLEVPGIRPALITDNNLAERIDELRRFRHLFRNLYKTRLHHSKLRIVDDCAINFAIDFFPAHTAFVSWLRALAENLDSPD
jgi:hypothetical protein